jgi:arylsulfatase
VDESFDIGSDTGTSVEDKDYQPPFAFNGALGKITIKLEPAQLNSSDQKAVQDKNGKRD